MRTKQAILRNLASAFLAGPWSLDGLIQRGVLACGRGKGWLRRLAGRVLEAFAEPARLGRDELARFIEADPAFVRAWARESWHPRKPFQARQIFWVIPSMAQSPWPVPPLPTSGALAEWLNLNPAELNWFADCHGREADVPTGRLRHYTYQWLSTRSGKRRLLEMPKQRLKDIQRRVLHEILDRIPPHDAVHGYRRGRSVATYTAPHAGQRIVLHLDLRDFFPSIRSSRVHALFASAGYPSAVARLLTGLCTNIVPAEVWKDSPRTERNPSELAKRRLFGSPHLPQGAPTSPALANLCAYRLDCRLAGLARSVDANYTRYADDLAFSGGRELERGARRFQVQVCRIALEEGFEVHTRKTRFMRQAVRQQLAGTVLNVHPNIGRKEYDLLKAILHNCARHGPESQNREGRNNFQEYLAGRIAYVRMINPSRGQLLRALFERIRWDHPATR